MNWHPYKVTALYCRVDSGQHSAMPAACAQNQQKRLAYYAKEHALQICKYLVTAATTARKQTVPHIKNCLRPSVQIKSVM